MLWWMWPQAMRGRKNNDGACIHAMTGMRAEHRWSGILAGVIGLLLVLTVVLVIRQNWQTEALRHESTHSLLLLTQFRSSLGNSHLWLEEFLVGHSENNLRLHRQALDKAREKLHQLGMYVGDTHRNRHSPAVVIAGIQAMKQSIAQFSQLAEQRLYHVGHAGADSSLDAQFDRLYMKMMADSEHLARAISQHIETDRQQQQKLQRATLWMDVVLFVAALLLSVLMWWHYQRARQRELAGIRKLQDSEQRFRLFFEHSPVALKEEDHSGVRRLLMQLDEACRADLRQYLASHPAFLQQCAAAIRITHANAEAVRLYGYKHADELMQNNTAHLQQQAQQTALMEKIIMLNNSDTDAGRYVTMQNHHGERMHVIMRIRMLGEHHHDWSRVVISLMDIAPQIAIQQQLDAANQHLQQAQSIARIGSWELDFSDTKLTCSEVVCEVFGLPTDTEPSHALLRQAIHPDDCQYVDTAWQKHINQQEAYRVVYRILRSDGRVCYIEEHCNTRFDADGKPVLSLGTVQDVSRLVQAEQQAKMLQQVFRTVPDMIGIMDNDYHLMYANHALRAVLGVDETSDLSTIHLASCFTDAEATRLQQEVIPVLRHKGFWQGEVVIQHARHGLRHISLTLQQHHDGSADNRKVSVIGRDITDRKQRQDKLEHMQRLESLGVLAGGIAHDFNNLLTVIMGHAAMARERHADYPRLIEHLDSIIRSSNSAADLCRQMLAYSGKGKFVVEHINLSELVREMTRLLSVSIHKQIALQYNLAEDLPAVAVDIAQLQQVIMNLVINAGEAIGEQPGTISVSTGTCDADRNYLHAMHLDDDLPPGTYVYLEVTDTGCGMNENVKSRLFEPFFTTKFTGRGLGMSAILGIVRGHRGTIQVYSEPGKGSSFKILLPASDRVASSLPAEGHQHSVRQGQHSGTILIVDDEESIRQIATLTVRQMGFDAIEAEDGIEAIARYRAHQESIVAVLLDMTMPRMGGEDTFSALRQINPDVRVILSSGYNAQTATQRFVGKQLAGFIQKPYSPATLQQQLQAFLGESQAADDGKSGDPR